MGAATELNLVHANLPKVTGETGVEIAQGTATLVWCDGDDIRLGVPTAEVAADLTPQLGGDLDANGFNLGFDDATGITDDAGNEQVRFQKTASAVNQIDVTNAAEGNAPQIAATGDDTNIDLALAGKGTGGVVASFKNGTGLGIKDSDASHDLKITTSSDLSADRKLTLVPGDADRTVTLAGNLTTTGGDVTIPAGTALVAANNLSDVSSAATAFGAIKQAASDSATGVIEIADQTEMEAQVCNRQGRHAGAAALPSRPSQGWRQLQWNRHSGLPLQRLRHGSDHGQRYWQLYTGARYCLREHQLLGWRGSREGPLPLVLG